MKNLRHHVNVMRPTGALSDGGQQLGKQCVLKSWPCSIETLSGSESQRVHTQFPEATHKVEGYGDPSNPFRRTDWLELPGLGTDETGKPVIRRLNIAHVDDKNQNGQQLTLICGENPL